MKHRAAINGGGWFFGLDITGESRLYFAAPSGNGPIGTSQRYQVYFNQRSTVTFKWINWGHYSSPGGLRMNSCWTT